MRTTYHIIAVILATFMAAMIFGTSFLLQTLGENYIFIAPSSCFYAIAALLLILIISVTTFYKLPQKLINKNPRKITTLLFLLFVSITILLSIWFPADINNEYLRLHRFAIDHPNSLSEEDQLLYFSRFPYQINVATIFAYFYKIFHSWRAVILLGAMSALGACFITAKVVYNKRKENRH